MSDKLWIVGKTGASPDEMIPRMAAAMAILHALEQFSCTETEAQDWAEANWREFLDMADVAFQEAGVWAFCGVFDSENKAKLACTTPDHFYAPACLDKVIGDEAIEWPGMVYPMRPGEERRAVN